MCLQRLRLSLLSSFLNPAAWCLTKNSSYLANFAAVLGVDDLALSAALAAHGLDLLEHAGRQLLDLHLHACAAARGARLHRSLRFHEACYSLWTRCPSSWCRCPYSGRDKTNVVSDFHDASGLVFLESE